ncbi:hypothetical protein BV133_2379 [Blastochloris viridis]|uniref:Uncharacterized protein n=1 Tax=Blastochloris viridis TaxID=1079 RepID=A0A182D5D2_BLAVI|nr:hypothetical protein BV133_2379 [Blastochloris viridis]
MVIPRPRPYPNVIAAGPGGGPAPSKFKSFGTANTLIQNILSARKSRTQQPAGSAGVTTAERCTPRLDHCSAAPHCSIASQEAPSTSLCRTGPIAWGNQGLPGERRDRDPRICLFH